MDVIGLTPSAIRQDVLAYRERTRFFYGIEKRYTRISWYIVIFVQICTTFTNYDMPGYPGILFTYITGMLVYVDRVRNAREGSRARRKAHKQYFYTRAYWRIKTEVPISFYCKKKYVS